MTNNSRFPKAFTYIASGLMLLATLVITITLLLDDAKAISLNTDRIHYYTEKYYSDNVLLYENTLAKGEKLTYKETPEKDADANGAMYFFLGWDITGDFIPDTLPDRIYGNIKAKAVYLPIPNIDLSKIDLAKLLELLEGLNIDLESFMNFLGLDPADLAGLEEIPVITYKTDDTSPVVYFRTESFGDYNSSKHKWNDGDYYSSDNISEGSVNPLLFASDKMKTLYPNAFHYDMEYMKSGKKYPVPVYEYANNQNINSDSYSLSKPLDLKYSSDGVAFLPALGQIITLLQATKYSSKLIEQDELKYREYVYEHFLNVEDKYRDFFEGIATEMGLPHYKNDYGIVDGVYKYFSSNGFTFNYSMTSIPKSEDPILYFLTQTKEGIGRQYAAAATLFFRTLGIPARYVQGYFDFPEPGVEVQLINALQAHSWCEIYIDEVGWLVADPAIALMPGAEEVLGDDYGGIRRNLERVELIDKNPICYTGDTYGTEQIDLRAYYDNGDVETVHPTYIAPAKINTSTEGKKLVTAVYIEGNVSQTLAFALTVIEPKITGIRVLIDEKNSPKLKYELGEVFTTKGLVVVADLDNGKTRTLSINDLTIVQPPMDELGKFMVEISYEYKEEVFTTSYEIEIIEPIVKVLESISISHTPSYGYVLTDPMDLAYSRYGTTVLAKYDNGQVNEVTGWIATTEDDIATPGEKTIKVSYTENEVTAETSFKIKYIDKNLQQLSVTLSNPSKIYDGTSYTPEFVINGLSEGQTFIYEFKQAFASTYKGADFSDYVNVGRFMVQVEFKIFDAVGEDITSNFVELGFFNPDYKFKFQIEERPLTITTKDYRINQNAEVDYEDLKDNYLVFSGLLAGHQIDMDALEFIPINTTLMGTYELRINPESVHIFDIVTGIEVTDNYDINFSFGDVTVGG